MPGRTRIGIVLPVVLSLLATGLAPASAAPRRESAGLQMYEAVVDASIAQAIISSGDYDVVSTDPLPEDRLQLVLVLSQTDRKALTKQGVTLTVWHNDKGITATSLATAQESSGYKVWRDYDGPGGIADWMTEFAAANPDITELQVIGQTYGTDPAGGPDTPRDILAIRLTKDAASVPDGSRPAVLYTSLQHAREWISTEVNRRLLTWYVKRFRQGSPDIVGLLGSTELWFVLVANPDGYQYTFTHDRLWRKTLRDNDGDNLITQLDGVDPNRNYPDHWNFDDEGSSPDPSNATYRGPSAGSEPETQAIMGLYDRVPFAFHVNYHSFGQLLLYTFGDQVNSPSADDPIFVALSGTDKHPAIPGFDPGVGGRPVHDERRDDRLGPWAGDAGLDPGARRRSEWRRVHLPGQRRRDPGRVQSESAVRPERGDVRAGPGRSQVKRGHRRGAVLSRRLGDRRAEVAQPDERLLVRRQLRRPTDRRGAGQARHRQRRRDGPGHRPLVGQRRTESHCPDHRMGGR